MGKSKRLAEDIKKLEKFAENNPKLSTQTQFAIELLKERYNKNIKALALVNTAIKLKEKVPESFAKAVFEVENAERKKDSANSEIKFRLRKARYRSVVLTRATDLFLELLPINMILPITYFKNVKEKFNNLKTSERKKLTANIAAADDMVKSNYEKLFEEFGSFRIKVEAARKKSA